MFAKKKTIFEKTGILLAFYGNFGTNWYRKMKKNAVKLVNYNCSSKQPNFWQEKHFVIINWYISRILLFGETKKVVVCYFAHHGNGKFYLKQLNFE